MNPLQKVAAAILIAVLLLPVAIVCGWRRLRRIVRAGRLSLSHGHHD